MVPLTDTGEAWMVNLIHEVSVSSMVFDHFLIKIDVLLQKPPVPIKTVPYRTYRSIDKTAFVDDLKESRLIVDLSNNLLNLLRERIQCK